MKAFYTKRNILIWLAFFLITNTFVVFLDKILLTLLSFFGFIALNIFAGITPRRKRKFRNRLCSHGAVLLGSFVLSVIPTLVFQGVVLVVALVTGNALLVTSLLICALGWLVIFWNGMLSIYAGSTQLGIRYRVMGALLGMIPIVNIFILRKIMHIVLEEAVFEEARDLRNEARSGEQICRTRYPIVLVHGVFFRDWKLLNYWGRIPEELETNGAKVYYGNHESASPVSISADQLTRRIRQIVEKTGCEKVNIIAHSKGGLDCRYALSECGAEKYVASLTTINSPHRGCEFADYLLKQVSPTVQRQIAETYNRTMRRLGDQNPDFMGAVKDLTASSCQMRNEQLSDAPGVYYRSVGSVLHKAREGRFPMNFSYHLVNHFDGVNDGLVGEKSFQWGEDYRLLAIEGDRGIAHSDMTDISRENIPGFDVREFYVELVRELKDRGL